MGVDVTISSKTSLQYLRNKQFPHFPHRRRRHTLKGSLFTHYLLQFLYATHDPLKLPLNLISLD